jgi:hypothetical protein
VLGFHPQNHVGFQVDPRQQQRPDEIVLASVVKVQAQLVVTERLGEHPGPAGVAVCYRPDQRGHQVALATEVGGELEQALAVLARRSPARLSLAGLPAPDAAALISSVYGGPVEEHIV